MARLLKTITMTLDPASIDQAIKEIYDAKKQLEECLSELAKYLTDYGQEIARMELVAMDAEFTGELIDNGILGFYNEEEHCGAVYTDKWYAMYVEFGTGFEGDVNPHHPLQKKVGWAHDVHGHGSKGWWYPAPWGWWIPKKGPNAGKDMAWTRGMAARPFMYNTLIELERIARKEGIDFFHLY